MSSLLSAELSATCNALGTYNKRSGKYLIDDYTLNTVKDLIRYLRRDGEEHEIRRHFGQTKVLQTDLIPMLIDHWEQPELFDVTLRLLVNLTNPALLLYREEVPTERTAHHNYLQILTHLQFYKEEAFTKVETWTVFAKKLAKILEIDWTERDEDTGLIIERILILIRNVLHVPADLDRERRPENDASVHDQVLWSLNQSGILDIILYMSSENEKQYFMHIVEIISHLLREQNPTSLADAALQRSVDEKLRDEQELLVMRANESKQRSNKVKQYSASRHSRFGGTYVMQNMKSLSDNDVICLKPLNKISSLDFSGGKKDKLVKPKNRRPVESGILERRSAFAIRLFLKEFCIEFLNSSYNPLMHYVKDVLVRARAQQNDESYYLWAIKFFMEFNRGHNFQVGLASETMSVTQFHYVQQQMEKYYDMIKVEKKKFQPWVRRLHLALRAYKELLQTLLEMEKSSDSSVQESAKVLKSNIFYVLEYREFILSTFLGYDENKMPRSYLVDLVETVHLFLKMLEHYCKKTGLVVQKKVRKKAKSKKRKAAPASKPAPVEDTVAEWEEVRPQLAVVLGSQLDQPAPFDAASDTPLDEQREDCMKKIQRSMREYKFEDAVGTFRAAREVWPEEGIFGVAGIAEDEELTMLETIYNADLGVDISVQAVAEDQDNSENDDDEEDEEEERSTAIVETDFDFKDFALRFCHPLIISACVSLLETYESSLPHTNHCCVKMLHRVAWDAQRPSMLFQGTLFLVFQRLLHNPMPQYKEIEKFAIFIIRKFTEVAAQTPKAFIELLFWKNMKECAQIQHGYDLYTDAKDKPGKGGAWAEEQEEELRRLYMENQINPQTDQDVIDWILENLIDQTRTRRGVIAKLKELGLIFKAPTKRSNKPQRDRVPLDFGEEEDDLLRSLWAQYGDSADPMGVIISRMPRNRAKHIYVDRLLELGLINDKKECRKKRQKSHRNKSNSERRNSGSDDNVSRSECSDNSDSDSDGGPTSPMATLQKKSGTRNKQASKSKREAPMLSAGEIARLLVQAVDNDLSEALKWVAESLEEVALDQEADGFDPEAEGTPLVPISAASGEAMENELFLKVLRGVGVHSPVDEQETYWRIPSTLHFETIRKRREIIIKAVNKELIIDNIEPEPEQTATSNEKDDSNDDDDDLFSNLRKFADNNDANVNQSHAKKPIKEVAKKNIVTKPVNRKRSRSIDADDNNREKMQKIDEVDEDVDNLRNDKHGENDRNGKLSSDDDDKLNGGDESDEDILSFAKRTLQTNDLPDTEDILKSVYKGGSDDSEDEIVARKPDNKRRRIVINDDSD